MNLVRVVVSIVLCAAGLHQQRKAKGVNLYDYIFWVEIFIAGLLLGLEAAILA